MPWQSNNNSGGPWGSGGGGNPQGPRNPWGQGGGGGGRGGRGSGGGDGPDLDEFIRRSQEKLRKSMPGGGGGANMFLLAIGALVLLWIVSSSFYLVQPGEVGVVKRFGEYERQAPNGLNFKLPAPIETVTKLNIEQENSIDIGGTGDQAENFVLTGDQNIADIAYVVRWRIKPGEADKFLFTLEQQESTIKEVAEFAMREAIARTPLTDAIGPQRAQVANQVQNRVQDVLDSYGAGIAITGVFFRKVDPPRTVEQAFKDVSAAQQDAQTFMNQANAYRQQIVSKAQGDTARFDAVYEQYRLAPEVTRKRLYMETMENVLSGTNKIILDADGVVPYLPLPEVARKSAVQQPAQ